MKSILFLNFFKKNWRHFFENVIDISLFFREAMSEKKVTLEDIPANLSAAVIRAKSKANEENEMLYEQQKFYTTCLVKLAGIAESTEQTLPIKISIPCKLHKKEFVPYVEEIVKQLQKAGYVVLLKDMFGTNAEFVIS